VAPGKVGGHVKPKISDDHRDWVLAQVAAGGDVTLMSLTDGLAARGLKVDPVTVWNFLRREGKRYKKTAYGDEQTRPDVAKRRAWWRKYLIHVDINRLVFIDGEPLGTPLVRVPMASGTKTNMAPLRGWGSRGKRLIGRALHGRWKTLTFLAALRAGGITAPWLLNGPINGESFLIYVREVLVHTLRKGDIVVMDNIGSHKAKATKQAIRDTGARLVFLPPYSPDLNPIEQFFAKLKHLLRKAKERTEDAVCDRIGTITTATSKPNVKTASEIPDTVPCKIKAL
jgi:transposase